MFIILLSYLKPMSEVDRFLQEHREFLARYYASGHLLMSGPQEPRNGGVIIARAESKAAVEKIIQGDPFYREQIAKYDIIEFRASTVAPALAELKEI
jgi:uncharacterized protein YciI